MWHPVHSILWAALLSTCHAQFSSLQFTSFTFQTSVTSSASSTQRPSATSDVGAGVPTAGLAPCAVVSKLQSAYGADATGIAIPQSAALSCLNSVPIDTTKALALLDYMEPYLEFDSTIGDLKNPPTGYLLPGVDVLGGLGLIKQNLQNGVYKSEWTFEQDLHNLINVKPHEGHLGWSLPLLSIFTFATGVQLYSMSTDGISLPQVYIATDIGNAFTPSPIATIDSVAVVDYVQKLSVNQGPSSQDPDALYNQMFYSLANQNGANLFYEGANPSGFTTDTSTLTFANGTHASYENLAQVNIDFKYNTITSGSQLYNLVVGASSATKEMKPARVRKRQNTCDSLANYPDYVVAHPDCYVAGFFSANSTDTAILVVQGFSDETGNEDPNAADADMQATIEQFITLCQSHNRTKIIVDLQGNGGGSIFNAFDAFKQFFPGIEPFGGTRLRDTAVSSYLGSTFTNAGVYNADFSSPWQIQSSVDQNEQDFANFGAEFGPNMINGDFYTSILRYNLSDPVQSLDGNGIVVTGYGNLSSLAKNPAPFLASNIVLLTDGYCASSCTIFSELMGRQGGVRSVVLGGRPMHAPMQALGGTKGAQVQSVYVLREYVAAARNVSTPPTGVTLPSLQDPPIGVPLSSSGGPSVNFRNNYASSDVSSALQFVYEAANCRLFYTAIDAFQIDSLWERVNGAVWGGGPCVAGSTPTSDNKIGSTANNTVLYSSAVKSNVTTSGGPGNLLGNGVAAGYGTTTAPTAGPSTKSAGLQLMQPRILSSSISAATILALLLLFF